MASPHALRRRMRHDNVYPPDRAIIALERFFTEPNLTALMGGNLAPLTLYGAVAVTAMLIFSPWRPGRRCSF